MNHPELIPDYPVFFERNRVFRVYRGGKLFADFFGDPPADGNHPEEWIASPVRALNKNSADPHEGLSKIRGTQLCFDELLTREKDRMLGGRQDLGILVKMLDSAIRLPVQTHPDKAFSRRYFHSDYGKTECWIVTGTRENAGIYLGFKNKLSTQEFSQTVLASKTDKGAMERLLNFIPVKKGDVFLIPSKTVHAIGSGCLILEIQEPTDFTIQPEAWCGEYRLSEYEMYLGLNPKDAWACFDFDIYGDKAETMGRKNPATVYDGGALVTQSLIGAHDTDCFSILRHQIKGGVLNALSAPAVYIATEGEGAIAKDGYHHPLRKGDYFFLPYACRGKFSVKAEKSLELIECLPPGAADSM